MSGGGRAAVYSTREKVLLSRLVKEFPILENKKTDGATVSEKNRAWERLTVSYNSQPEVNTPRTTLQLRKLWSNLKQRKRIETTALRHHMLATGGGPAKMAKCDPVLECVPKAAASLDVTVDNSPWDSTHALERAENSITFVEWGHTAEPEEAVDKLANNLDAELVASSSKTTDKSFRVPSTEPVPSTSRGTDEFFFSGNPFVATPSADAVVADEESANLQISLSATSPTTADIKPRVLPEEPLRRNRQVEATHQQQELHILKKHIAEEKLLGVKEERQRAAQRSQIVRKATELDLRRATLQHQKAVLDHQRATLEHQKAVLDHRRAADEAELASLKLKLLKKGVLSEDH